MKTKLHPKNEGKYQNNILPHTIMHHIQHILFVKESDETCPRAFAFALSHNVTILTHYMLRQLRTKSKLS